VRLVHHFKQDGLIFSSLELRKDDPRAARSKANVCGRFVAGIADSNTSEGMDFVSCVCMLSCVGKGLFCWLITRAEEFYRVSNFV
jgi:hypothetical protein